MGIMDKLFGPAEQGTPSNAGTHGIPAAPQPPVATPAPPAATPAPAPSSPLDAYSNLWDTPVDEAGKPIANPADLLSTDIFNFDPTKIREQAAGLDFVKDVNPELLARVTAGGADGTAALLELLNGVQQQAFAAATMSMGKMVNAGVLKNNANLKSALPSTIRAAQLADTPVGDNPALSHPAVQPLINALRVTAFNQNPNANPADVAKKVNGFIEGLVTAMAESSPTAIANKQQAEEKTTDFRQYFGM